MSSFEGRISFCLLLNCLEMSGTYQISQDVWKEGRDKGRDPLSSVGLSCLVAKSDWTKEPEMGREAWAGSGEGFQEAQLILQGLPCNCEMK